MKSKGRFIAIFALLVTGLALSSAAPLAAPKNANSTKEIEAGGSTGAIVFADDQSGHYQIYEVEPDGTNLHRLTNSPGENFRPVWSPDGSLIAFLHAQALPPLDESIPPAAFPFYSIKVMNADGSNQHELVHEAGRRFNDLSWSPDSRQLAFSCAERGTDSDHKLCIVALQGGAERQITPANLTDVEDSVTWSPTGEWIAFAARSSSGGRSSGIYVISPEGSAFHSVVELAGDPLQISWSPDGMKLAYIATDDTRKIAVINIDGSNKQEFDLGDLAGTATSWSPDGGHLLFLASPSMQSGSGLYTIARDGTAIEEIVPLGSNVAFADWSSDGREIAYAREVQEPPASTTPWPGIESEIGVASLDSSTMQRIVESGSSPHGYGLLISSPDWRPAMAADSQNVATEPASSTTSPRSLPSWVFAPGIAAIRPDGVTPPDAPAFTADEARDYAIAHAPFQFDSSQPPTVTVEFLTRTQLEARLNQRITVANQDLYCLVTFHGHFSDNDFTHDQGTGPIPGNVGFLIFDAHTGNQLGAGSQP